MEQKNPNFHNEPGTWQTGRTEPPKRYSALISVLLVLVILLSGISTALSIMNMKLYWKLSTQETTPQVAFSRSDGTPAATEAASHEEALALRDALGITGTIIPRVYQRYYKLPNGLYVTQVDSGSQASENGLVVGDIITKLDNWDIQDDLALSLYANSIKRGEDVTLTLYRSGSEYTMTLRWDD
jgi:PDZ domain-containing secreted protein